MAVSAGLATLKLIQEKGFHERLTAQTKKLMDGMIAAANEANIIFNAQNVGGMFGLYFSEKCPTSFHEMMRSNKTHFNQFFHSMLNSGIYLGPSAFEAGFVSAAHSDADIAATITAAKQAFSVIS